MNKKLLFSGAIKPLIVLSIFTVISFGSQLLIKPESSYSFSLISNVMAELDASEDEGLSEDEESDKARYESIKDKVTEDIGSSSVSASALAETIKTVGALFGVKIKIDYDKKAGLSCFSLDSSGVLNIVSCSSTGDVISSCDAIAAADWKSATISCTGFKLKATTVE
jgi:hypothetical protein|tara:strand:- start:3902 stop:4402 length:501 start_codon:yes stop_codon:yes gene_type:complete